METEIAWAAGFFDGEGSTYIKYNQSGLPYLRIALGQVDRFVLDRFCLAFGHSTLRVNGPYTRPAKNRPDREMRGYRLQFQGPTAIAILNRMWPYLSPVKKKQAKSIEAQCKAIRASK